MSRIDLSQKILQKSLPAYAALDRALPPSHALCGILDGLATQAEICAQAPQQDNLVVLAFLARLARMRATAIMTQEG